MIDFEFLNFCAFFLTSLESIRETFCVCCLQVRCNYLLQKQCLCLSGPKNLLLYCRERTEKSECWAEKVSHIHHFISSLNRFNKPFGCAVYKWRTIAYCKSSVFVRAGSKISSSTAAKNWESECWAEKVYHLHHSSLDAVSINNNFFRGEFYMNRWWWF